MTIPGLPEEFLDAMAELAIAEHDFEQHNARQRVVFDEYQGQVAALSDEWDEIMRRYQAAQLAMRRHTNPATDEHLNPASWTKATLQAHLEGEHGERYVRTSDPKGVMVQMHDAHHGHWGES